MEIKLHNKLKDIENAPAFDKSCHPRCEPSRAVHPLAKKLLYTPHYKLAENLNLDKQKIQTELKKIENINWSGYNNDVKGVRGAGISTYWTARMLRNFTNDSMFGFGETLDFMELIEQQDKIENGRVKPEFLVDTEIVEQIPYLVSTIKKFVTWELCDRIMISRVEQSQRINWHSHCSYEKYYTHAYLHIPLVTNENANMLVYMDNKLHIQHYAENEAWIINTQHNHAVNNKDGDTRYHILCLANFEDPKFNELFLD